ncbi:hypothetical protein ACF0H5_013144 [Mactra antiquata]
MEFYKFCPLLILCLCCSVYAWDQNKVDSLIKAALKCREDKNPGLTASAVKDGKVIFANGYGYADVDTQRPVTNTTLFGIASMSKAFAAALMIKLLHDNHLSIYSKPRDILPEGFAYNTTEFSNYATVRDLMTHCLGVPTHQMMRLDKNLTRKEAARRIRYFEPVYKFRVHYLYSNLHYGIVSYLSEVVGGKTWEDLIQENFYNPLGMTHSDFLRTVDRTAKDVAQGYADDEVNGGLVPVSEELNKHWGIYGGSTGLMSCSEDITKWMLFQLKADGTNERGERVMDGADLRMTHSPQTAIRSSTVEKTFHKPNTPFTVSENDYAFGWKNGFYKGYKMLRHTGTTYGYSSLITLLPDVNIGVFTSMTGEDEGYATRTILHSYILDSLLDNETPSINETTVCTFPEPWMRDTSHRQSPINTSRPPTRPLQEYVGVYHQTPYGEMTISINTTNHQLQLDYGYGQWILYPETTSDSFAGEPFGYLYKLVYLKHVKFHVQAHPSMVSVEIPSFESKEPPVFYRVSKSTSSSGSNIIG